jgi:hypothetical protein
MAKKSKTIEVCVGVGMDQLTPEYITVEIPQITKKQQEDLLQQIIDFDQASGLYDIEMSKDQAKDKLIETLWIQMIDLSMMSKIELGDDVIAEINRLKKIINDNQ